MIKDIENLIMAWLKTVTYKGEQGVDIIATGPFEDLEERNAIVTVTQPLVPNSLKRAINNQYYDVSMNGSITFLFRRYDEDSKTITDAEDRNSVVPDVALGMLIKDGRLNKTLKGGKITPIGCISDRRQLLEINSVIYYVSRLDFQYTGRWIESTES